MEAIKLELTGSKACDHAGFLFARVMRVTAHQEVIVGQYDAGSGRKGGLRDKDTRGIVRDYLGLQSQPFALLSLLKVCGEHQGLAVRKLGDYAYAAPGSERIKLTGKIQTTIDNNWTGEILARRNDPGPTRDTLAETFKPVVFAPRPPDERGQPIIAVQEIRFDDDPVGYIAMTALTNIIDPNRFK